MSDCIDIFTAPSNTISRLDRTGLLILVGLGYRRHHLIVSLVTSIAALSQHYYTNRDNTVPLPHCNLCRQVYWHVLPFHALLVDARCCHRMES